MSDAHQNSNSVTPYGGLCCCSTCGPPWRDKPRPSWDEAPAGHLAWGSWMALCSTCGNKRCPAAANHDNTCIGSNEPGQPGSNYPAIDPTAPRLSLDERRALVAGDEA